jgi:hypothetical protein
MTVRGRNLLFLLFRSPGQNCVYGQRILHINDDANRWIDSGDFFHGDDCADKRSAVAFVPLRDFHAHDAEVK